MILQVTYTNWRGETALRTIAEPYRAFFGANEWHTEPQWLLEAFDVDKQAKRTFSFAGLGWETPKTAEPLGINP